MQKLIVLHVEPSFSTIRQTPGTRVGGLVGSVTSVVYLEYVITYEKVGVKTTHKKKISYKEHSVYDEGHTEDM